MPPRAEPESRSTGARSQLLDAATGLILERGFAGASVDEVCAAAGVSKGSYYHYFDSKEHLAQEVLAATTSQSCDVLDSGAWREVEDGVDRAVAFMDHVVEHAESLWGEGCIAGILAMEMAAFGPPLRDAVSEVFAMLEAKVRPIFEPLVPNGTSDGPDAGTLARQLVRIIEGGSLMSRCAGDAAPLREALSSFRHYLTLLSAARSA